MPFNVPRPCRALFALAWIISSPMWVEAQTSADSASVAATAGEFHHALARGDSAAVLALLAPDATIMEAGDIESREEYRQHHLPADIAFVQAVPSVTGSLSVVLHGDVAWVMSTSRATGTFKGRKVDSRGAELLILSRSAAGWQIRAIHWSSR
jgi:ketosteroid isomerase-like protein